MCVCERVVVLFLFFTVFLHPPLLCNFYTHLFFFLFELFSSWPFLLCFTSSFFYCLIFYVVARPCSEVLIITFFCYTLPRCGSGIDDTLLSFSTHVNTFTQISKQNKNVSQRYPEPSFFSFDSSSCNKCCVCVCVCVPVRCCASLCFPSAPATLLLLHGSSTSVLSLPLFLCCGVLISHLPFMITISLFFFSKAKAPRHFLNSLALCFAARR